MKTAVKLILIYFGLQLFSAIVVLTLTFVYNRVQGNPPGSIDMVAPALILSFILMGIYLWKAGYIRTDKQTWSPVSPVYLGFAMLACLSAVLIIEYMQSLMPELPNLMEGTLDALQSSWLGIASIALFGPVIEELIFRGAITPVLLRRYSPTKAIVLSALAFGIFHINPAQVITAALIGLLLGWIYYRTASLIPCILIHVINNSLSVYLSLTYPQAEYMRDIFTGDVYYCLLAASVVALAGSILWMRREKHME